MRAMRSTVVLALALLLAVPLTSLPARPAHASIVEAMSLAEMTAAADVILVARVEDQRARYDAQGRIVTDVSLRVEDSLLGGLAVGSTTIVLRLGGVVGDLGLRVEGEAVYQTGESIVLFARRVTTREGEALRPVGMAQGVLPLAMRGGVEVALPGGVGLELVTRETDGSLVPAQGALTAPRGRDELLDEVRALVAERVRD
jgi:hypothetical protein